MSAASRKNVKADHSGLPSIVEQPFAELAQVRFELTGRRSDAGALNQCQEDTLLLAASAIRF